MKWSRYGVVLILLMLVVSISAAAFAAPPQQGDDFVGFALDPLQPITPDNIAYLQTVGSIWWPDQLEIAPFFSPDSAELMLDNKVIDLETGARQTRRLGTDLAYSPDGTLLAIVSDSGVAVRDVASAEEVASERFATNHVAWHPDGQVLAVGQTWFHAKPGEHVAIWDRATNMWSEYVPTTAKVLDVAFSPDGDYLACATGYSGEDDAYTVWLVDGTTYEFVTALDPHQFDVTSVSFSPDGTLLASGSFDMTVNLWDVATWTKQGTLLLSGNPYSQDSKPSPGTPDVTVTFSPDGRLLIANSRGPGFTREIMIFDVASQTLIMTLPGQSYTLSPDGRLLAILNNSGNRIDLWAIVGGSDMAAATDDDTDSSASPVATVSSVQGTATSGRSGLWHPFSRYRCTIHTDDTILAVARTPQGALLAYTSSPVCEGPVWIENGVNTVAITWENPDDVLGLPQVTPSTALQTIETLPDYEDVCDQASAEITPTQYDQPYAVYSTHNSVFPAPVLASQTTGVEVVYCHEVIETNVDGCTYRTVGTNFTYTRPRIRRDLVATLVDYQTGGIIAQQTFTGQPPSGCPSTDTTNGQPILGAGPDPSTTWQPWVLTHVMGSGAATRTTVNVNSLNARREPNTTSDILYTLSYGTPVNLIARNEAGDWVAALLPDMSQAWLFVDLLTVATQTDIASLPVSSEPAGEVAIPLP